MIKPGRLAAVVAVQVGCALLLGCGSSAERLRAFLQQPRSPVSATEYRVLPPDILTISSLHVPDINNVTERVRPDGKINLPLIGEVYVADLTPKEIEDVLKKAAREYYEQVDATVRVVGYNSQKIYVFGQVGRPGPIPWTGCDTLLDVLAQVQPTTLSWPEKISVVRGKPPQQGGYLPSKKRDKKKEPAAEPGKPPEEGGGQEVWKAEAKQAIMQVNMMKMVEKGDLSQNVLLRPNDVVYVPPNPLAAIGLAIQQILMPIRPAAETVTTPAYAARAVTYGAAGVP